MSIGYGDPRVIKDEFGSGVCGRIVGMLGEVVLMIGQIAFVRDQRMLVGVFVFVLVVC